MKISDNLKALLEKHNLNTLKLSRHVGIAQPVIYRLLMGETDDPKLSTVLTLANHFGITVNQLIGETPTSAANQNSKQQLCFEVPLLTWEQATEWPNVSKPVLNSSEKITIDFKPISNIFALRVDDESMLPAFAKGALLIIDGDKNPKDENYIIAKTGANKKAIFRQLLIDDKAQYLKPLNPDTDKFRVVLFDKRKDKCCGVLVQSKTDYINRP